MPALPGVLHAAALTPYDSPMERLRFGIARVVYYGAVIIAAWFFAVAALATVKALAEGDGNWPGIAWYAGLSIGIYAAGHAVRYLLIGR